MAAHFFIYKHAQFHYTKAGNGCKTLLAFHGFGQTNADFQPVTERLSNTYTVFAFDLFFHGKSQWPPATEVLTKVFWQELLTAFLAEQQIERFSLMGFSLGGKFALATLESFPAQIDELILIAPDGIKTSFWYSLATYPGWARRFFRQTVISPSVFRRLADTLRAVRLADKSLVKFARRQMETRAQRLQVYYAWTVFRELSFNSNQLARLINEKQIPVTVFLGRYDRIITQPNLQRLLRQLPSCRVILLESGHHRLLDAVAEYYAQHHPVTGCTKNKK